MVRVDARRRPRLLLAAPAAVRVSRSRPVLLLPLAPLFPTPVGRLLLYPFLTVVTMPVLATLLLDALRQVLRDMAAEPANT